MTITITGARGFLGSAMSARFRARGHEVRDTGGARLGSPASFAGSDCVIHAAHDFGGDAFERNRSGTVAWFEQARRDGVAHQVFLSSFSARSDSPSLYGRTKFAIERVFLDAGEAVARPGLVAGPGGLFAKFARSLGRWHVAPLVAADARTVAVVALGDFLDAITAIAERSERGPSNLFARDLISGREFAKAVWRGLGTRGAVIDIPPGLAIGALRIVGARSALDSLRGQLANAVPVHRGDLERFVSHPLDAVRAVELAVRRS